MINLIKKLKFKLRFCREEKAFKFLMSIEILVGEEQKLTLG